MLVSLEDLPSNSISSLCMQALNRKWFGLEGCCQTHSALGPSTTPTLQGFEACDHDLILQLDVDLMMPGADTTWQTDAAAFGGGGGGGGDAADAAADGTGTSTRVQPADAAAPAVAAGSSCELLAKSASSTAISATAAAAGPTAAPLYNLVAVLQNDPSAISISLPTLPGISRPSSTAAAAAATAAAGDMSLEKQQHHHQQQREGQAPGFGCVLGATFCSADGVPWRTEVRGCLVHRKRLLQLLPLPPSEPAQHTGHAAAAAADAGTTKAAPAAADGAAPLAALTLSADNDVGTGDDAGGGGKIEPQGAVQKGTPWGNSNSSSSRSSNSSSSPSSSSSSSPPRWYRALDDVIVASGGTLRCYRAYYLPSHTSNSSAGSYSYIHEAPNSLGRGFGRYQESTGSVKGRTGDAEAGGAGVGSKVRSSRGGWHGSLAFLHPTNKLKGDPWAWSLVESALRAGCWPREQRGEVRGREGGGWECCGKEGEGGARGHDKGGVAGGDEGRGGEGERGREGGSP